MEICLAFQPFGIDGNPATLGTYLIDEIGSGRYSDLLISVAFATSSGTSRVAGPIRDLVHNGGTARVICGIGNGVTSKQAIEHLLVAGAAVQGIDPGVGLLFHQKAIRLVGADHGVLIVGSNNLTRPGLFEHFEASVVFNLDPRDTDDNSLLQQLDQHSALIADRFPENLIEITAGQTDDLVARSLLRDETIQPSSSPEAPDETEPSASDEGTTETEPTRLPRIRIPRAPAVSEGFGPTRVDVSDEQHDPAATESSPATGEAGGRRLIIQIRPHHNGEIFLSKTAVDQDRNFFGWPFTGTTTPKRAGNQPYPQREPDPIVDLCVYGDDGALIERLNPFHLNTVYYSTKSEIRITIPPTVAARIPQDSILVMRADPNLDYVMHVYPPESEVFNELLVQCDQRMPSGGSPVARRFGWVD